MTHRVLILIVAYQAERHIRSVLERIPKQLGEGISHDVLVLDDASSDTTSLIASSFAAQAPYPLKTGRNEYNQGYGGNQKIGYRYAISHGYDHVVLLHGDGQYPPEHIGALLRPLIEEGADAVLGSRMRIRKNALKGGMPLYKWVGNIGLTQLQNALLGTRLSEFHTGFRAYRASALAAIPFEANSPDFSFDTDILIQLLQTGKHIAETDIPTHYGDEICRVPALRYALQCIASCLTSRLQKFNVFYQRKFDYLPSTPGYTDKTDFPSSHAWAVAKVKTGSRVLDIGCGQGLFVARRLVEKRCTVFALDTLNPPDVTHLPPGLHFRPLPLDFTLSEEEKRCDTILLLDVLEHIHDPEAFLKALREQMQDSLPSLYITTPNIAFILMRIGLLFGLFNYGKKGILDRTHHRLFTARSLQQILIASGFAVTRVEGIPAPLPLVIHHKTLCALLMRLQQALIQLWRNCFSYQLAVSARTLPTVETLMTQAHIDAK